MSGVMSKAKAAFLFGLTLLAVVPGCAPPVPAAPTYATDVRPILMARCVRCHGETLTGETLNGAFQGMPSFCHFTRYDSQGDCSATGIGNGSCTFVGAGVCAVSSLLFFRLHTIPSVQNEFMPDMPYGVAPKLDDWQVDVVTAWLDKLDANGLPAP
jgi:hypothetical protein